jgi:hypothetical protein
MPEDRACLPFYVKLPPQTGAMFLIASVHLIWNGRPASILDGDRSCVAAKPGESLD